MMRKTGWMLLLVCLPMLAMADLEFSDPWAPLAPPGRTMAGFMTIANTGEQSVVLIDGASPQFNRIEIHDMVVEQGVMRMRRLDQLEIEPASEVVLRSGSFHIMLMEPKGEFVAGDVIDLVLIDAQGKQYPINLEVRPR